MKLPFMLVLSSFLAAGCVPRPRHVHLLVPDGYRGTLCVSVGTVKTPADQKVVIVVSESGYARTSSDLLGLLVLTSQYRSGSAINSMLDARSSAAELGLYMLGSRGDTVWFLKWSRRLAACVRRVGGCADPRGQK